MQQVKLARSLTIEQDLVLRDPVPEQAKESDYDPEYLFHSRDGDVRALKEDGSVLLWIVSNAFEQANCQSAYQYLKNVQGDPTSRPETVGTKRVLRRRSDGTLSKQFRAPLEKTEEYKQKGAKANVLGYFDRTGGAPYCRQSAWTAKHPEILKGCWCLINPANRIFKELMPERHEFQDNHVSQSPDFTLGNTCFSTITVNKKLSTTYHRDEHDLRGGFGVMLTLGDFKGGQLVYPAFRCAVDYQPGDLILADVHETHGNVDNIEGDRITLVLYARENIDKCGLAEDEEERMAGSMSIHARED